MIFLSSLPRSGSTLLTSLLNQRNDVYATPTSNLSDTMGAAVKAWEQNPTTKAGGGKEEDIIRILRGIQSGRYDTDKLVIDKSRGWSDPTIISTMEKVQGDVKIIATVRPVADCLASFVKIAGPDNVNDFCKRGELAAHLFNSYHTLKAGYEAHPDKFLFVEYDDLVADAATQMDRVADFIGLDRYAHDLANVPDSGEVDEAWGIDGLHKVRPQVRKRAYSPRNLLGEKLYSFYQGGEFWNDKPEPVRDTDPLDLELEASLRGEFDKAWQISETLKAEFPECNRSAFNRGWHLMQRGELLEGHQCLQRGREEEVFGNKPISGQPAWEVGDTGTVLLTLEGGFGDQLHGFRYANNLTELGNRVVVSSSAELAPIFSEQFVTCQHEAAAGVYHDFHVQAMSAPLTLGLEYPAISGEAYIPRTAEPIQGRVGLRWQGNPRFEHEQHRLFPASLLFDAVEGLDCVSLQRDEGVEHKPEWMPQADVSDWSATRKAISECERVVTSCTSIAHLSAAMGVETFIVVPILPYYLWALPGATTPYYDSVTLLRQTKFQSWSEPFKALAGVLEERLANAA